MTPDSAASPGIQDESAVTAGAALLGVARGLIEQAACGALATLGPDGFPFASLVATTRGEDGAPMLLLSHLAVHTVNLSRDPRASLLIAGAIGASQSLANPRLTLTGIVIPAGKDAASRERFLARHPDASAYVDFADFEFHQFRTAAVHLVAGFGRIARIAPADLFPLTHS